MKILKLIAIITIFLTTSNLMNGQQFARYSQYMFNGLVINPAYAGSSESTSFTSFYRNQWATIEGAPVDMSLSAHGRVGKKERVGLGAFFSNDRAGKQNHYDLVLAYSYRFPMANGASLSAGLQGGLFFYQANLLDGDTPEQGVFDSALSFEEAIGPNFGAGLYYQSEDTYVGLSVPFLLNYESPIGQNRDDEQQTIRKSNIRKIQYLLTAGKLIDLNGDFKVKPSFLFRLIPEEVDPVEIDLTGSFFINKFFMVGNSWRFNSGVRPKVTVFMMSYQFPSGLRFGYAYEYSFFSDISRYSSSHEILLGFDVPKLIKGGNAKVLNPRYF